MTGRGVRVKTASRLHFGLLGWGPAARRQFGGVGLMIERPGNVLTVSRASVWSAEGPLAARALSTIRRVAERLGDVPPLALRVESAAPEHAGLGTGTQISLAAALGVAWMAGRREVGPAELAAWTGRGQRSGIGLHGFAAGGLLVDGGRRSDGPAGIPPLLSRLEWPETWSVLVALPSTGDGLHGPEEARAFDELPPMTAAQLDRVGRLVLLELLPTLAERDLDGFGAALEELQHHVGAAFAPAQGGLYGDAQGERLAAVMRQVGLRGVGQSSWGPALYGLTDAPAETRTAQAAEISTRTELPPERLLWTRGVNRGARIEPLD
ncbi:MAG: beta-ribofuranosylaminobenzene 5'-phosphate synthase [Isosphaeraceae bacterium]|nr:MAG: beta-ribofuranosylaminobenzene 5'-phosphate synthase [Isosphaeraceae bacterium]